MNSLMALVVTAATLGLVHTALGPDHYLPFVAISRARGWSAGKTAAVTTLCGIGHVLSSVVLGFVGISFGIALFRLEAIEAFRGDIAAWLLMVFGFTYFVWGLWRALRNRRHAHAHTHDDGETHSHVHAHGGRHAHVHQTEGKKLTPWVLFLIFVFGPCEPLIPLVMFPAAEGNMLHVAIVAGVFALATVGTMLTIVMAVRYGLVAATRSERLTAAFGRIGRFSHAAAGLVVMACGGAITFLGL